jgi:hypothetical protein
MALWDLTVRRERFFATSYNHVSASSLMRRLPKNHYLGDTLLVLSSEENGPCNATGILALEEKRFGLAVLESEDLAITTNVELALFLIPSASVLQPLLLSRVVSSAKRFDFE